MDQLTSHQLQVILLQSLIKVAVPREQIILAYKGEPVPNMNETR